MIEVTNKVFTFLTHADALMVVGAAQRWNKPELDPGMVRYARRRAAARSSKPLENLD